MPLGDVNTPDEALAKLAGGVLYKVEEKYTLVSVDLSAKNEGDIVPVQEGDHFAEFYIAKRGYETGLNGAGRTLLVRKECYDVRQWNNSNVNTYAASTIDNWLNSDYKALLSEAFQTAIGTTKIYYTPGNGDHALAELERSVFQLSMTELGEATSYNNVEGAALPIAGMLKIAYLNGQAESQWTRSPLTDGSSRVNYIGSAGGYGWGYPVDSNGSRPAFTLPDDFKYSIYQDMDGNYHLNQEYRITLTDILGSLITLPSAQLDSSVKIETGSYVGTGTYGSSNPNSLTFGFQPKMIMFNQYRLPTLNYINGWNFTNPTTIHDGVSLLPKSQIDANYLKNPGIFSKDGLIVFQFDAATTGNHSFICYGSFENNKFIWCCNDDESEYANWAQANFTNYVYNYIAIG